MNKTEARRQLITEMLADHILARGLQGAGLRSLAAAAGTSDRMLLHYFKDKEELLTATLLLVSARLEALLESARSEPLPFHALLPQLAGMLKHPDIRPYLKLWLELAALAAGEGDTYRPIARSICDGFFDWITATIKVEREADRIPLASLALATIEGLVLLDALDMDAKIDAALEGLALTAAR
jgi:AcrR family transcriptional regulator